MWFLRFVRRGSGCGCGHSPTTPVASLHHPRMGEHHIEYVHGMQVVHDGP
jgi:hypothetical protein